MHWPDHPRRGIIVAVGALGVVVTVVALVLSQFATAARPEPWPGFTMVYEDTVLTASPAPLTQRFRMTYVDRRHFTTVLIAHSTTPDAVGWTHTVNGTQSTTNDPRLGPVSSATWKPEDQVLPSDWLRPGPKPWIAYRPGAITSVLPDGLVRVSIVSVLDGREDVEEFTVRFVERVDGKEVRHVEVLELTFST
jgi:hypothetical protein